MEPYVQSPWFFAYADKKTLYILSVWVGFGWWELEDI